jgi:hypothetical protein
MAPTTLKTMTPKDLEGLYDHFFDTMVWPGGTFFHSMVHSAEDLAGAMKEGTFHAFLSESGDLYGLIVTHDDVPAHLDIIPLSSDEELTPEQGKPMLEALLSWGFANTKSDAFHKYLDHDAGPVLDKFQEWGFQPIESDERGDGEPWQVLAIQKDAFSGNLG